jgi:hypothetical protein
VVQRAIEGEGEVAGGLIQRQAEDRRAEEGIDRHRLLGSILALNLRGRMPTISWLSLTAST